MPTLSIQNSKIYSKLPAESFLKAQSFQHNGGRNIVNSEELELSLRTEFESHLKDVVADMRQEVSQFQEKIEAEFEKHKSQLDEVFQEFSARIRTENRNLKPGFAETVVEHLRLARDEGARITATAFAEAEEMAESRNRCRRRADCRNQ